MVVLSRELRVKLLYT